jgi:hypothetical protein
MQQLCASVLWQRLDLPASEYCALSSLDEGWELRGAVCAALDDRPLYVTYVVRCDSRWETSAVEIRQEEAGVVRTLRLRVDAARQWWQDDTELRALRGCVDVDLGITPATNTLPMRRLGLAVGDAHALNAAWVSFPDLSLQVLAQRYTRLGEELYRYESLGTDFTAALSVDDQGLVIRYAGLWDRVAPPVV